MACPTSDAVFWYIQELTANIVAETGLPSDRYHVGKILLRSLKDAPGDMVLQIDGATDQKDTFKSVLERSVACATAFRNLGLEYQDVVAILAPNHINLAIPLYAALFLGIKVAGIDITSGVNQLYDHFKICVPRMIFCQNSNIETVQQALSLLHMSAQIIIFDESDQHLSFQNFLEEYGKDTTIENFKPAEFDAAEAPALLLNTSGSTGPPKTAILTHKNVMMGFPLFMNHMTKFPTPINLGFVVSPVKWISSHLQFIMGPILRYTRLQSSTQITPENACHLINRYKPDYVLMVPNFWMELIKISDRQKYDFSSLMYLSLSGLAVTKELFQETQKRIPKAYIKVAYAFTEGTCSIFNSCYSPIGSIGTPTSRFQYKLVDPMTNEVINTPNTRGELLVKGPTVFQGYYNSPEFTKEAFDEEGWYKSGDVLYRDEYHNYYYYDRVKMVLRYKGQQIYPVEIESVIRKHPGVFDVAVSSIFDLDCDDLPVALVIPRHGHDVTAQEIKNLVKESLSDFKQLRGGVIFVKEFPLTTTSKIDKTKLREWANNLQKE